MGKFIISFSFLSWIFFSLQPFWPVVNYADNRGRGVVGMNLCFHSWFGGFVHISHWNGCHVLTISPLKVFWKQTSLNPSITSKILRGLPYSKSLKAAWKKWHGSIGELPNSYCTTILSTHCIRILIFKSNWLLKFYRDYHCGLIGYLPKKKQRVMAASVVSMTTHNKEQPTILNHSPASVSGVTETSYGPVRSKSTPGKFWRMTLCLT